MYEVFDAYTGHAVAFVATEARARALSRSDVRDYVHIADPLSWLAGFASAGRSVRRSPSMTPEACERALRALLVAERACTKRTVLPGQRSNAAAAWWEGRAAGLREAGV